MSTEAAQVRPGNTVGLFALLFAIGSLYLASLGYFLVHGSNFVDREKMADATRFAQSTSLTLPAMLQFKAKSEWARALATGWNRPESWGVWSDRPEASIVLPAIAGASAAPVCIAVKLGAMGQIRRWPMTILVNGRALAPKQEFTAPGPFVIRGTANVPKGSLIHLQFSGPEPKIPNLISRNATDPRSLGFSLFEISIAAQCGQT